MKLYYMPGACSLAAHIALNEIGATFDIEKVDGATKRTESGRDFAELNPNGYVPALELDDGEVLIEAPAILQYLADTKPETGLAPAAGTLERVRVQQHLNFIASELHKSFTPFFAAQPPEGEAREIATSKLNKRMDYLEGLLADGREYLMGETFTVADAYAGVVASWSTPVGIDLGAWPNIAAYVARITGRPAAAEAMRREGLLN